MAIGLVYLASSQCQFCNREGLCCSMSAGTTASWIKSPFDGRRGPDYSSISFKSRSLFFGSMQPYWLPTGQELSLSKVRVSADYSDSLPDSPRHVGNRGYHPLEEVKDHERNKDMLLTDVEIARTTVEANSKALLVFPGRVHSEPHGHVSWAEYQYVIDDYGDIFFEFFDDDNILQDRAANNPVTMLIGMDAPIYGENKMATINLGDHMDDDYIIDVSFDDDHNEIGDTEITDTLIKWGMPDTLRWVHPMYFAKCLSKAVNTKQERKMDRPSNGLSIVGCLRPAFIDEESYLRRLFHSNDGDDYMSDWRDESEKEEEQVAGTYDLVDGEMLRFNSKYDGGNISSTLYKLEIMSMELHSVYGGQSMISLQDFQDAEPDVLAHSASAIIERSNEYGVQCNAALRSLCRRRKGLVVERANLIGVDSLGMDVRVFSGMEAQTIRFSFNARATSESAAEKKIKRMLFPRYYRKKLRTPSDGVRDS
ncbi:uncharacterized protein At3g49140 isoform X2 [Phoenix dactylifera]|uniref:Uncharacterized protein At3g49140 isoform X2 n=1 Tax=Phoenix dactylifera TaxID=42345 RepID=A0A8B7CMF4_PHODC|nr:uncharacterized protein At3g49140 isoform X2 [Phoenix dactylifera]